MLGLEKKREGENTPDKKAILLWGFTQIITSLRRKTHIRNSLPALDRAGRSNMLAFALQELQGEFSPPFDNNLVHPATQEKPLLSGVFTPSRSLS